MNSTSSAHGLFGQFQALSWKFKLAVVVVGALLLFIILASLLNAFNYSIGTRTGIIEKLSRKGVVCWTSEGQLALPNFQKSGTLGSSNEGVDNTFYFSVPDKDVQKLLEAIPAGSPVTLEYHQKLFALDFPLPLLCLRRTQYEIVGVKSAPAYAPLTPPPAKP